MGFFVRITLASDIANLKTIKYWDPQDYVNLDSENLDSEIDLDNLLNNAVKNRMYSDVPIGTFLSGGIDSSLITAIMQANSKQRIKTFSIGFVNLFQYLRA